jgi:hypothetical protein
MATTSDPAEPNRSAAARQFRDCIGKFNTRDQALIRAVRAALRRRLPTANELVYDNYNFFVIGYSATERPSDAVLSIAAKAGGVSLCFIHGAKLPDPNHVLQGAGNQTRFIRLESARTLERRDVAALVSTAIARSPAPFTSTGQRRLIMRSVSTKQRPRRK